MPAKQILYDEEARRATMKGIDKLAKAVKATLGAQGRLDGLRELVYASQRRPPRLFIVQDLFRRH